MGETKSPNNPDIPRSIESDWREGWEKELPGRSLLSILKERKSIGKGVDDKEEGKKLLSNTETFIELLDQEIEKRMSGPELNGLSEKSLLTLEAELKEIEGISLTQDWFINYKNNLIARIDRIKKDERV